MDDTVTFEQSRALKVAVDDTDASAIAVRLVQGSTAEVVRRGSEAFRAALPQLLARGLRGRWVLYLGDTLVSHYDDGGAAYEAAVTRFGPDSGFVVAKVADLDPQPLCAAMQLVRP